MDRVEAGLIKSAGSLEKFRVTVTGLLRRAVDEVIDSRRSGRYTIDELEKTEKTYLGTKIEILLRNALKLTKGQRLDLVVDGIEVDVKNTMKQRWTIPEEAVGHPCLLIRLNDPKAICWVGLLVVQAEYLTSGFNKDRKRAISTEGERAVRWIIREERYPSNFWEEHSQLRSAILNRTSGTERVAALFELVQRRPIHRDVIEALTQQKDYMKRVRKNGGARDLLRNKGIAILWGKKDRDLIKQFGLPACTADEFIAYRPVNEQESAALRTARHIA